MDDLESVFRPLSPAGSRSTMAVVAEGNEIHHVDATTNRNTTTPAATTGRAARAEHAC
jgi:hypothetical protein